ncbi:hypothetical protein [Chitinophaga sp.]|uniref:hypothetical protein n=1 Tax=Chitinophaga sp. TaxID=1869181 RepID=UPI0031D5CBE7
MKNMIFFRLVLAISVLVLLLACMELQTDLAKFRVATRGVPISTKITNLYQITRSRRRIDFYAEFEGAGVQRMRRVSEVFYNTHQIDDEVTMKYLPDESVILYEDEQRKSPLLVRGIIILLVIGMLIVAWKIDKKNEKKRKEKVRMARLRRRRHQRHHVRP